MPRYSAERVPAAGGGVELVVLRDANAQLEAAVAPARGGELASLKTRGRELLHRGGDYTPTDGWAGRAPVLFPGVGRQRDARYAGGARAMALHGFAKDCAWEVERVAASDDDDGGAAVTVRLARAADAGPLHGCDYPFGFELRITYRLADGGLRVDHEVRHTASPPSAPAVMPFGLGNHITLAFPFTPGGRWEDGRVVSDSVTHEYALGPGSLLTGATVSHAPALAAASGGLPLTHPLATNGVLGAGPGQGTATADAPCELTVAQVGGPAVTLRQWYSGPAAPRCCACGGDVTAPAAQQSRTSPCCGARTSSSPHAGRHFVLWGEPTPPPVTVGAPVDVAAPPGFLCPEPWLSGPDSLNTLDGTPLLRPGEAAAWHFTVSLRE